MLWAATHLRERVAASQRAHRSSRDGRFAAGNRLLQSKPACACGGACPRCRHLPALQAKLAVSHPGDPFEQEADRVAEQVLRMPEPMPQQECIACAEGESLIPACRNEKESRLGRKPDGGGGVEIPAGLLDGLGPGRPLDPATRGFFEPRFGHDFSRVRVHTGARAAASAQAVNAVAFTVGPDIVFGAGQYAPGAPAGDRLLAHELTHTIQQGDRPRVTTSQRQHFIQRKTAPARTLPSSPWDDLPATARSVLQHSFDTRDASQCGKSGNPEWMWCGASAAECFNRLEPERRTAFRSVYGALSAEGLWDVVVRVVEIFGRETRGIKAKSIPSASLMGRMVSNRRFCRDTRLGGRLHPGEVTWRQVVAAGTEGLHVGVGLPDRMTAHLDALAPVAGREPDGYCRYSMPHLLPHYSRDVKGWRHLELFPVPTGEPTPGEVQPWLRIYIPGT